MLKGASHSGGLDDIIPSRGEEGHILLSHVVDYADRLDFEFLVSRWYSETYTLISAWEEFTPTLKDVVQLIVLHVFGDRFDVRVLKEEDEAKLHI